MLDILRKRRTAKVIGNPEKPNQMPLADKKALQEILESAGNAPFHYACDKVHTESLTSPVPWRCYKLDRMNCQKLMTKRIAEGDTTKIPNMLAAAEFLFQITWLPDAGTILDDTNRKDGPVFEGTLKNMEHIAAASAFIQSVVLAAEAQGYKTYWSSGGPLRSPETFEYLAIPNTEILLGSVFLFPRNPENAEIRNGNLSDRRETADNWSKWCTL